MLQLLNFPPHSRLARFVAREKRFLVHVLLAGQPLTVHTNNSGSMRTLLRPDILVLLSLAANLTQKSPYILKLARPASQWIGVNTLTPNRLLKRAWETALLPELTGYDTFQAEAVFEDARLDARLSGPRGEFWIEAKNVSMVEENMACFPDAVTLRGQKHLRHLMTLAAQGQRVGVFFAIQRPDAQCFGPAAFIDPEFARLFWQARDLGVEFMPYRVLVSPDGIGLGERLPLQEE